MRCPLKELNMKVVIQRVKRATVTGKFGLFVISFVILFLKVSTEIVGSIEAGLCLLVGIACTDTEKDIEEL